MSALEEIEKLKASINHLIDHFGEWTKTHKYHYHYRRVLETLWELEEMKENLDMFGEIQDPSQDTLIQNGETY